MIRKIKIPLALFIFINLIICFLYLFNAISKLQFTSLAAGSIIAFINFIIFIILFMISVKKSNKEFLVINLGGMAFRIGIILISIFLTIKFLKIDKYAFIFALFIWYIFFLIVEINQVRIEKTGKTFGNIKNVVK